jgi:TonB family protein
VTEALPLLKDAPRSPLAAPRPAAPASDDSPYTVQMAAPGAGASGPATAPLKRPPLAAGISSPPTPTPVPASQEKTILMNVSTLGLPPPKKKQPTEARPRAETADSATVMMSAASLPQRASEPTVKAPIAAPLLPPTARLPTPPTVRERSIEDALKPPTKPPAAPVGIVTRTPAPSRGLPIGLIVGGAGLLFVVALILAGVALFRGSQQEAAPVPEPTPTPLVVVTATPPPAPPIVDNPGVLRIASEPPGASIALNGEPRGTTPVDLGNLAVGIYDIKVELKGYAPQVRSLVLTSQEPQQDVAFSLSRAQPATGSVDILSTPFGAAVKVDGSAAGETPLTGHRLKPGLHRVEITIEGHQPWSAEVNIEAGKRARVDAQLAPSAVSTPPPAPRPDVADPNQVFLPAEVDTPPRKLKGTASYPDNAPKLRSGESASVSVSFVVTEDGDVTDPRIVESGGKTLDDAVLAAVRNWKYTPGAKKGVSVKVRMTVKQTFRAG